MTCDKHTGEYYSIPCSHCFTAIDSVSGSLNRSDTLRTKPFHTNWPPPVARVREHEYNKKETRVCLYCLATAMLTKIEYCFIFLSYA